MGENKRERIKGNSSKEPHPITPHPMSIWAGFMNPLAKEHVSGKALAISLNQKIHNDYDSHSICFTTVRLCQSA